MENRKILFRIPLTIYWVCWDKDFKKFLIATKNFNSKIGYYWEYVN